MNTFLRYFFVFLPVSILAQNVSVDSQSFNPQQLIEDILIDSDCISSIQVTNVVGGDFGGSDQSYGYFNSNGSNFPLQEGIILSTGRLANAGGPNTTLSDDDAQDWSGDSDLEVALNETGTINATILEFTFQSSASEVRFRYLFASEEYQENNENTCRFSDLFGFLIRREGDQNYQNIAIVPDTNTPVKVTTVHPEIPNGCEAENEFYFDTFNDSTAPINFNGQTKVLEAKAIVMPNVNYEVKLVIADESNYRYDSAVFLEAGSFQLGVDLGEDRTISGGNPLCGVTSTTLSISDPAATAFQWSRDGTELLETSNSLEVTENGFYEVIVDLQNNCQAFGEVNIEFADDPQVFDSDLNQCDANGDGISMYNLFDGTDDLTGNSGNVRVTDFYRTFQDAETAQNPIQNPTDFTNESIDQIVFAVVKSQNGCSSIAKLTLTTSNLSLNIQPQEVCDDEIFDGITALNLAEVTEQYQDQLPQGSRVGYYLNEDDAFNENNQLPTTFTNTTPYEQELFIRVSNGDQCISISPVLIDIVSPPLLTPDEDVIYCESSFPNTITLNSGVSGNTNLYDYQWEFEGNNVGINSNLIDINEVGVYTVTVTAQNGCSSTRSITVAPSNPAVIDSILVTDDTEDNRVEINVSGNGIYEYAIGSILGPYQESNFFQNLNPGFYEVYVRDRNGCGTTTQEISILGFPKYFTPNGDGVNDTWNIKGANTAINPIAYFQIFNRFGKLLYRSPTTNRGWDGNSNGKVLPSSDYWYLVAMEDGRVFRGHFSLIR